MWTGEAINSRLEVDHCFPFTYWPNNDLWNLLPVRSLTNSQKSSRLPSAALVEQAEDRILSWWETAYNQPSREERFFDEASTSLPGFREDINDLEEM